MVRSVWRGFAALAAVVVMGGAQDGAIGQTVKTPKGGTVTFRHRADPAPVEPVKLCEPVQVAGTRVRMGVPEGYVATRERAGFRSAGGAEIMVYEVLEPMDKFMGRMMMEVLRRHRVNVHKTWPQEFGCDRGHVAAVSMVSDGVDRVGYFVAFGDDTSSAIIFASVPDGAQPGAVSELRAAGLSALLGSDVGLDRSVYVRHSIRPAAPLKRVAYFGSEVVHTGSGYSWPDSLEDPVLFSDRVRIKDEIPVEDRERVARVEFSKLSIAPCARAEACRPITISGLPALELEGSGHHYLSREPLRLYMVMVFEPDSVGMMRGAIGGPDAAAMIEVFRKSAATYAPKAIEQATAPTP